MSALTKISQALFQARGLTDIGSLRDVQIKRQGKVVDRFDVYDLLLRGNSHQDIRLHSGDVVFVPTYTALVEVSGEVTAFRATLFCQSSSKCRVQSR